MDSPLRIAITLTKFSGQLCVLTINFFILYQWFVANRFFKIEWFFVPNLAKEFKTIASEKHPKLVFAYYLFWGSLCAFVLLWATLVLMKITGYA